MDTSTAEATDMALPSMTSGPSAQQLRRRSAAMERAGRELEAGRLAESTGINLPNLRNALMMSSGDSAALRDWDRMTFTWALKDMQMMERGSFGGGGLA